MTHAGQGAKKRFAVTQCMPCNLLWKKFNWSQIFVISQKIWQLGSYQIRGFNMNPYDLCALYLSLLKSNNMWQTIIVNYIYIYILSFSLSWLILKTKYVKLYQKKTSTHKKRTKKFKLLTKTINSISISMIQK